MNFDFRSIFGGGFNNNFDRTNYGVGNPGGGGNYGGWGNSGAVQASYNTQTLPNLNTQSTMNSTYGASFASDNNSGGWGNAGGFGLNTGWGNRSNESGRYSNYVNQYQPDQPYNNFLRYSINPGQERLAQTRERRTFVTENIIDPLGQAGFWQPSWPGYPQNLYNV